MKQRLTRAEERAAAMPAALLLCLALCGSAAAAPQFNSDAAGTTGAQFLKMATGARGAALGEAYSALADDAFALDWNPAGLINISHSSLALMHAPYLADTALDYAAYAENSGEVGAWGVSAKRMSYGRLHKTDSSGAETGSFSPSDLALSVGLAAYVSAFNKDPEDRFVLGASGKMIRSSIVNSDSTLSTDIGILTPLMFDGSFRMALVAQNVMGSMRFDKEETQLPLILRLGSLTRISSFINMTADIIAVRDHLPFLAAGMEARIAPARRTDLFLRAGVNTRAASDLAGSRNFSLGAGARHGNYSVDYAFSPFGELGAVHRLSLAISFTPREPGD